MIRQGYDVFLSYSRLDAALADQLVEALRNSGYRVFYDKESLVVGERWKDRLSDAIRASRVCVLCWSEHAKKSEIVGYEYSRAEGLKKPVLPWLLDTTPLPQMIELQGIVDMTPASAAAQVQQRIGWTLTWRRRLQTAALLLFLAATALVYMRMNRPPPPWEFDGRVTDSITRLPIVGVLVSAEGNSYVTHTSSDGTFKFLFPQPRQKYVRLVFAKEGYRGEDTGSVPADRPWPQDMQRLEQGGP